MALSRSIENRHEEGGVAEDQLSQSISVDRRANQGAGRLAGEDAQPHSRFDKESRSGGGRGVEVERSAGVVARRIDLHRRDLQERREDDVRKRGVPEGSLEPLQLKS